MQKTRWIHFLNILVLSMTFLSGIEIAAAKGPQRVATKEEVRLSSLRSTLKTLFPHETIQVTKAHHTLVLSGNVSNADTANKVVRLAREFTLGREVVNLMNIKSGQQVMLRVRVGEIQRAALKEIGVNLQGARRTSSFALPFSTNGGIGNTVGHPAVAADAFATGGILYKASNGKLDLSATLDMLEQNGLFRMLAEPNLVAISGEKAQFLAGGEFPVPVAQREQVIAVEYKPFGVQIDFAPLVLAQNRIRLTVEPEVSEITMSPAQGAVQLKEFLIPAISSRRAKTTVELAPGESFMIAGLIKDDMRNTISQVPGLGEIPILSALFRSSAFQRNETELVIAVTPYLVDPVASNEIRLPTDDFHAPSVLDNVFFGALGAKSNLDLSPSQSGLEGPAGFIAE